MLNEKSTDDTTGNIIWGIILLFESLRIWRYIRQVIKKEEIKDYEAIIAEKDKIIERQQIQLNRITKLLKSDTTAKKKLG